MTLNIEDSILANKNEIDPELFPHLYNISSAFFYEAIPKPLKKNSPEFIYIDFKKSKSPESRLQLYEWNLMWEAAHFRKELFYDTIPEEIRNYNFPEDSNVYLLPYDKENSYHAYASLFHLIPQKTLKFHKLPLLKKGNWPLGSITTSIDKIITKTFNQSLSKAFASHIWPLINSGSKLNAFSQNESIKVLAHNLDFWLPSIFQVIENRLSYFDRVAIADERQASKIKHLNDGLPKGVEAMRPLMGGSVWEGEEDAWDATKEMIEIADSQGNLRALIDTIKSNRVEDDFSEIWSFAKEDFERKLYKKRSKIKVSFIELDNTLPVHAPDTECHENLLWGDFLGILNKQERQIVVCLRKGETSLSDIAHELGYANHSPISKKLKIIRKKAENYLFD